MLDATAEDLAQVITRLKSLADENRLRILVLLADGERCVCDLQDELEIGQSLLSFHLKTLREAGLVTDRRSGRWAYFALSPVGLQASEDFIAGLRKSAAAAKRRPPLRGCN
jgi:ArsR family transcriptional regulator